MSWRNAAAVQRGCDRARLHLDPAMAWRRSPTAPLNEITVTDCPANPECLITHRYPPSANVEFYNIIERGAQVIYKIAEVVAHQVVQAQRAKGRSTIARGSSSTHAVFPASNSDAGGHP